MAKKFMFVCIGIMALAVTFHIGAEYGKASIVDHGATGIIAASGLDVLLDNGEVWHFYGTYGKNWGPTYDYNPPVPVSEIKFWADYRTLYTYANEVWFYDNEWVNYGPPGGSALTHPTTWGKIKAEWGEWKR
jgi:hypothetical protein